MKWEKVKLGEIADFINGAAFKPEDWGGDGLKIIRIQNLTGQSSVYNRTHRKVAEKYIVRNGDLLVSWSATLGVYEWKDSEDSLLNQHIFKVVINEKKVNKYYLKRALEVFIISMSQFTHGSTMKHINRGEFLATEIPLPPLSEQERIASILDAADRLRALRRDALRRLDTLTHSLFLDTFGDPAHNPKNWPVVKLETYISFLTSGSRGWAKHYSRSGDLFLRIQNVGRKKLLLDDIAYVQAPESAESKRTKVCAGDLLLSITADLGRTAVIPDNFPTAYINQHLAIIRLHSINPIFVAHMMDTEYGRAQFRMLDKSAVKSGINFNDIRGFKIFAPPLSLQQEFASRLEQIETLRARMERSALELDALFASLQNEAFGDS